MESVQISPCDFICEREESWCLLLPLRCDSGAHPWYHARLGVPPRNASREKNPGARWKEMSYGEVVISERSFYGYRFFLQRYRGHKRKFLVRPYSLLGFSSIYCYLLFVL